MERLRPFVVENWLLFVALIVILALLFVNLTRSRLLGVREIRTDEAVRLMNHEEAVVIDTRPEEEFAKGHILGAVNVPFATLTDRVAELKSSYGDRPVIVCCEHGRQSGQAGAALKKNGFARPLGLAGGLTAWRGAGLPLVRT